MRTCGSCGRSMSAEVAFCGQCGAPAQSVTTTARCPACGEETLEGASFCGGCGQRLGPGPGLAPASTPGPGRGRFYLAVAAAAVVVVLAGVVAFVAFDRGSDDSSELDFAAAPKVDDDVVADLDKRFAALPKAEGENDRDQIRDMLGPPDAFTVSWESVGEEPEPVRYETWFYYELLTAYEFADGALIANLPVDDEEAVLLLPLQYDPAKFERGLTWQAVSTMLADPASAARTDAPEELGAALTGYAAEQLLVVFDDEGLVYAETIPLRGLTP